MEGKFVSFARFNNPDVSDDLLREVRREAFREIFVKETQSEVYTAIAASMLKEDMATLIAYGASGTGKTHTMIGKFFFIFIFVLFFF